MPKFLDRKFCQTVLLSPSQENTGNEIICRVKIPGKSVEFSDYLLLNTSERQLRKLVLIHLDAINRR